MKKYKYLLIREIGELSNTFSKRILSIFSNPNKNVKSGVNSSELPYPVKWHKLMDFRELYLEIGCGTGDLLKHLSGNDSESLFIGYEITRLYTKKTNIAISGNQNAYVFNGNGYDASINHFQNESLNGIYVLFPDPWHKRSHHKRRPLVNSWMRNVCKKLKSEGFILIATDWMAYYDFILTETDAVKDIYDIDSGPYNPADLGLTETYYYKKWTEIGRDFRFIRLVKK